MHDERRGHNQGQSFFTRLRRAEIANTTLRRSSASLPGEMAWREDHRRKPTGTQSLDVAGGGAGLTREPELVWLLASVKE